MKFKVRPGFRLFRDRGDAAAYNAQGAGSGVKPLALEGEVRQFTRRELEELSRAGALGRLEPVDAEATEYFGSTKPQTSDVILNPWRYAQPASEPERHGHDWRFVHA